MTALNPKKGLEPEGVAVTRYPLNTMCAIPDCEEPVESAHHIWGRPPGEHSDSWWTKLVDVEDGAERVVAGVTGLCGDGTRGCHGDLEEHRLWIKYEDGKYIVYKRGVIEHPDGDMEDTWVKVAPLEPQPGLQEKKKRRKFSGEARRKRKTISVKVPQDEQEDGAGLWEDAISQVEEIVRPGTDGRPPYYTIMDALNYTILNEGS